MPSPAALISARLTSLESTRAGLQQKLKAIRRELHDLDVQYDCLRSLIAEVGSAPEAEEGGDGDPAKPGPSEAILMLLAEYPQGLEGGVIATKLEGKINSASKDQRKVILNTLANLRGRGAISKALRRYRREDGRSATMEVYVTNKITGEESGDDAAATDFYSIPEEDVPF